MYALIIDDSRAMRRIITKIMTGLGFEVIEAGDGKEGYEQFEANADKLDVVLVDWNMPVMTGIEFIEAVRARDEYANHKLMMVTTESEPARMARALMSGVDEFVMKPFTDEVIVEKLRLIGVQIQEPTQA